MPESSDNTTQVDASTDITTSDADTSTQETSTTEASTAQDNQASTDDKVTGQETNNTEQTTSTDAGILGSVEDDTEETEQPTSDTDANETEGDALDIEYEVELPEGLEQAAVDAFLPIAKELKLSNDQVNGLVKYQHEATQAVLAKQTADWQARSDVWAGELKADPEFAGADGKDLKPNLQAAKRGLRAFGGVEAAELIGSLGLGNHPVLVKLFARVGRAMGEDSSAFEGGTKTGAEPDSATKRQQRLKKLYPSMFKDADGAATH